jgi:hypothetical protein
METLISVRKKAILVYVKYESCFNWVELLTRFNYLIQSRSHNELVVDKLQYYINYMVQGKYALEDAYGAVPFMLRSINPS